MRHVHFPNHRPSCLSCPKSRRRCAALRPCWRAGGSRRSSCAAPICAGRSRPTCASALTGARVDRPRPPRQIRADRDRPRRHHGLPSRHVGPLADRSGRDRASTTMSLIETDEGRRLALNDPRRFGSLDLVRDRRARRWPRHSRRWARSRSARSFDGAYLARALDGRSAPIKALLLDQRIVAGLGNIYVCEALNLARIAPGTGRRAISPAPGSTGSPRRSRRCCARRSRPAARRLRDYVQPNGELGYFSSEWRVYGREGQPCPALRRGDSPARRCGPLDLLLPEMPALKP